jgi:glycosyltransferase involved in cell wall biosynthesis
MSHINTALVLENYIAGGSERIANLFLKYINVEYLILNRKAEFSLKLEVSKCRDVYVYPYAVYTSFFSKSRQNSIIKKLILLVLRPFLISICLVRLYTYYRSHSIHRLIINNGGYPGGDICRAAAIAWRLYSLTCKHNLSGCIMFIHNETRYRSWLNYYLTLPLHNIAKRTTNYVFISNYNRRQFLSYYPDSSTSLIYNPVEMIPHSNLLNSPSAFKLNRNKSRLVFFLVGMSIRKDPLKAIKISYFISRSLPDVLVSLHIYGHDVDNLLSEIHLLSNTLMRSNPSFRVFIHGFSENSSIFSANPESLTFLLLCSRAEGIPLVISEAMAFGVPTISNSVGGVAEIVDSSTGLIYNNQSEIMLFVKECIRDDNLYASLSKECLKKYDTMMDHVKWSKCVQELFS